MKKIIVLLLVTALVSLPLPARAEWCDIKGETCTFAYIGLLPGLPFVALASLIDGRETGVITSATIGYSIFLILATPFIVLTKMAERSETKQSPADSAIDLKTKLQDIESNNQKGG